MADYLKLFEQGAELAGISEDIKLIQALAAIVDKWSELKVNINGATTAEAFIGGLANDIKKDEVRKAFEKVGLKPVHEDLERIVGKITSVIDAVPDKYKKLLDPVSTYSGTGKVDAGLVAWPLVDGKRDFNVAKDFKLSGGGSATIELEAGDRPTLAGKAATKPLLRVGVNAGVQASAAGTFPIKFGSVGGSASGSLDVALDYHFDAQPDADLFALAVARRLPDVPNPFDFASCWEAFQSKPLGLEAIVYTFKDKAKVGVELAVAAAGNFDDVLVAAKAKITAEASIENVFELTLTGQLGPAQSRLVWIHLNRGRKSAKELGIGISVGVDFSIPAKRVQDILKGAVAEWDAVLADLTPYLSPGTLLQTKLGDRISKTAKTLIDDEGLRDAIVGDLKTAIGIDPFDKVQLQEWLTGEIEKALNKGAEDLLEDVGSVRDAALAELARTLPVVGSDAAGTLREKLSAAIDPMIADAQKELIDKLKSLIASDPAGLAAMLKKAGGFAQKAVTELDEVFAPLRAIIRKVNDVLHQVLDTLGDASKMSLTAELQQKEQWLWGEEDRIVGTFTAPTGEAAQLFNRLTRGELDKLAELVHQNAVVPGFVLDQTSHIKKTAKHTTSGTFKLVLLGMTGVSEWMTSGEAAVVTDGAGNVQVDTKAMAQKRFSGGGETREISFVDTHSLRLIRDASTLGLGDKSIAVSVSIVDQDTSMAVVELTEFIANLERAALMAPGTGTRAAALFAQWGAADGTSGRISANLAARLRLEKADIEKMLRVTAATPHRLTDDDRRQILVIADRALDQSALREIRELREGIEEVAGVFELSGIKTEIDFFLRLFDKKIGANRILRETSVSGKMEIAPERIKAVIRQQQRFQGLLNLIEGLGQIYTSDKAALSEKRYSDLQKQAADGVKSWLQSRALFKLGPEIHPVTVAFLRTLVDLSGASPATTFALHFSRKDGTGAVKETVTLS